ncbi:MAG: nicotinate (nicotinamide) nucleotide adenylyltransferase [Spirochaeta sp. LUC14_002_19_P3]|nr:MAG: nicotinate (nicotinamide) nucleotide adenylyltransferase [Spirochaeta sp. LUC14_002_19_P3]
MAALRQKAVFGGSFDPVHLGHLALAQEVINIGYEQIIFVPAGQAPHKAHPAECSPHDRLHMLQLALKNIPWALIWDGELRRSGVSYSIDTLDTLREEGMVSERPGFIIGDDLAAGFSSWKDSDRLAASTLILLGRRMKNEPVHFPYPHRKLNNALYPYSSTGIKDIISRNGPLNSVLPGSVIPYIREKKLYGSC